MPRCSIFNHCHRCGSFGLHFIRVLRHPTQYWGWLSLLAAMIVGLITAGIPAQQAAGE
jgi:hypothetical protein